MKTIDVPLRFHAITKLFSDKSLTKKASLNALAAALDYAARLLVGFVITPFLVSGLGDFFYGTWQVIIRLIGYISPASGRPTQALKMTLANQQTLSDYDQKRRYVGSALVVWVIFLPLIGILGGLLAWSVPNWINAPQNYYLIIRVAAFILVMNLALTNLTAVPQSVLEGENLGYKRMGLSTGLVLLGGGFTWLALYLKSGIIGVASAAIAITAVTGIFWLTVVRSFAAWFGASRPSMEATRKFLSLSMWFMGWNLIMNLMTASDVVLLGMLNSVESVTAYTLTKYAPETLISLVAIVAFAIAPGLGGIIGSGKLERAAQIRGEIMSLTWLIVTVLGSSVLLWNRYFLSLWVGEKYYVGSLPGLLIVLVVAQFVLIRNDSNFIDLTLRLRKKVVLGAVSVGLSIASAAVFLGVFKWGVIGLSLGLLLGRFILTIGYPLLVGRYLNIRLITQLISSLRPALITVILFIGATWINGWSFLTHLLQETRWIGLIIGGGGSFIIILVAAFLIGLNAGQRDRIINRVKIVLNTLRD